MMDEKSLPPLFSVGGAGVGAAVVTNVEEEYINK